jgi:KaiC/GvpD/RAD55 family RecA-like ATPase
MGEQEGGTEVQRGSNTRVDRLVRIISAIVMKNKRIVTMSALLSIQKTLMRRYPQIFTRVRIDTNFNVYCSMPESDESLEALKMFLEKYVESMTNLLSDEIVSRKMCAALKDIVETTGVDRDIIDYLPPIVRNEIDKAARMKSLLQDIKNQSKKNQAIHIYSELFTNLIKSFIEQKKPKPENVKNFARVMQKGVKHRYPFLKNFKISPEGDVTVGDADIEEPVLISALGMIYDGFIFGISSVTTEKEATELGRKVAIDTLSNFDELPETSGVTSSLLHGALSKKVKVGPLGLDMMLGGGLLMDSNVLLITPKIIERDFLLAHFAKTGFKSGEGVLIILSEVNPDRILELLGADVTTGMEIGRIILKMFHPGGTKEKGASELTDLISLNKALIKIARDMGFSRKRAILDVIDPSIRSMDNQRIFWYLARYLSVLKEAAYNSIFVVDRKSAGEEFINHVKDLFDTVLEIRKRKIGGAAYEIGIVTVNKIVPEEEFRQISITDYGVSVEMGSDFLKSK